MDGFLYDNGLRHERVKNKKAADLKLQHKISRNNSFTRYLSPETY